MWEASFRQKVVKPRSFSDTEISRTGQTAEQGFYTQILFNQFNNCLLAAIIKSFKLNMLPFLFKNGHNHNH